MRRSIWERLFQDRDLRTRGSVLREPPTLGTISFTFLGMKTSVQNLKRMLVGFVGFLGKAFPEKFTQIPRLFGLLVGNHKDGFFSFLLFFLGSFQNRLNTFIISC